MQVIRQRVQVSRTWYHCICYNSSQDWQLDLYKRNVGWDFDNYGNFTGIFFVKRNFEQWTTSDYWNYFSQYRKDTLLIL